MAQTITCDTCHKTVYITDIQNGVNFDEKYLSCGHIQTIENKALQEASVVSQLTSSEPIICSKCNALYASNSDYMRHYNEKHKPENNQYCCYYYLSTEDDKQPSEPDCDEGKDQIDEKQEEEAGEIISATTNQVF